MIADSIKRLFETYVHSANQSSKRSIVRCTMQQACRIRRQMCDTLAGLPNWIPSDKPAQRRARQLGSRATFDLGDEKPTENSKHYITSKGMY
jgi:hypothetical protein